MSVITRGFGSHQSIIIRGFNIPYLEVEWRPPELQVRIRRPPKEKAIIDIRVTIPLRGIEILGVSYKATLLGYMIVPIALTIKATGTVFSVVKAVARVAGKRVREIKSKIETRGAMLRKS